MALPLPARVCGTYFTLWGGGTRITAVPTTYNTIYLFHAVPGTNGAFKFDYGSAVNAAEIKTCQDRGQRVVLTVGGANAGFNFQNRGQSQNFVNSYKAMNSALGGGLSGCDFNNFEAQIGSNPTEMTWISQQLKSEFGKDFSITAPPAPGAGWAPQDRVLCKAMMAAGVMDYAGPQFYDSSDLTQEATIVELTEDWIKNVAGGDASKIVVGLSANYGGGPTLAVCKSAWSTLVKKHPKLRGVFAWSAQDDMAGKWAWGKEMGALVGAAPVTPPAPPPAPNPPAPPPVPAGPAQFVPRTPYKLGDKVTYGTRIFEVYQVDATGTSNGTDPLVSTWYWREVNSPVVTPQFIVGDRVLVGKKTGTITFIAGTTATISIDNVVKAEFSTLKKAP